MSNKKRDNYSNIAVLFEKIELKNFFLNYLYFIIGIELLIFLISFLGNIGPDKGPFPWKFYFYVSFITPITITFLLSVFIEAFNHFVFNNSSIKCDENNEGIDNHKNKSKLFKVNLFLSNVGEIPLLPVLFSIIVGTVFFYKLDVILLFLFNAGEKAVKYIIILFAFLLVISLIFSMIWIVAKYKLNKKQLEHEYKYRDDVLNKLGILIMNGSTVIDKKGRVVHHGGSGTLQSKSLELEIEDENKFKILPPSISSKKSL